MYKSYYLNEQLLLDNWDYYKESNWLLKHILYINHDMSIEEKIMFYQEHRNEPKLRTGIKYGVSICQEDIAEQHYQDNKTKRIENLMEYNEETHSRYAKWLNSRIDGDQLMLEKSHFYYYSVDEFLVTLFTKYSNLNKTVKGRNLKEIYLTKEQNKLIKELKIRHKLNASETLYLFGLCLFANIRKQYYIEICKQNTLPPLSDFEKKQFMASFDKKPSEKEMQKVDSIITEEKINAMAMAEPNIYKAVKVIKKNNRLDFSKLFGLFIEDGSYKVCLWCNNIFTPKTPRQAYCSDECRVEGTREKARLRKEKQRKMMYLEHRNFENEMRYAL